MFEINTIQDFQALPGDLQLEVQKAIRAKDRLDAFLLTLNKRSGEKVKPTHAAHWEECKRCHGHPGWVQAEQSRDDSDVHPSQINKCLKFLFYSCAGYVGHMEEYVDSRLRMIFDLGIAWHDTIQRYGRLGAWGPPEHYHKEVSIDPDAVAHDGTPVFPIAEYYRIRGHVDALLTRYEIVVPGIGAVAIRLVHEYKTINSGQYEKLNRPKPEHKQQATIYSAVFNVPIVVYLYTNKDNCYLKDFPVPFDNSIWNEITQKIDRVLYYSDNQIVPPWEETSATKNPAECQECGFRKICSPTLAQVGRRIA